jgi:segregation and condensation protein A
MTAAAPSYKVQLPVFEGPLDLLLELIERAELDITKVALAQVTDQYLAYMRQLSEHQLADLAAFLVIAARLLQIKSEALLPRPPIREPGEEDPGEALARALLAYKRYKEVARVLDGRQKAGWRTYLRLAPPPVIPRVLDLKDTRPGDLLRAYLGSLTTDEGRGNGGQLVTPSPMTIRDQIGVILAALRQKGRATFHGLLGRLRSRIEVVVTFLAVLELVKQRRIVARQEHLFADIELLPAQGWVDDQDLGFEPEFGQ